MTDTGGDIHVLHVDTDPEFLEVVSTYLAEAEPALTLHTATSPDEGLDRVSEGGIDCVISDHRPPSIDGLSFLADVRELDPEMPFVLYTGHGSEEIASDAISAGVTDYLRKEATTDQYTLLANTVVNAVERRRAERAADESERRYHQVIEQSHDGIFVYRGDRFSVVNDRVCEITGYDRDSLHGMDIFELIHPDDRERLRAFAQRRRAGEAVPSRYRARIVTADGETRHLAFSVTATTIDGAYAAMGSVRDVTDRHRHEQRLSEFASIVAHDLRNPLNVISGRIKLARETGDDSHFDAIARGVSDLDTLITDMRTLADNAVPVREPDVVDLRTVAEAAWATVDADGTTLSMADGLGRIEADSERVERLLVELFENAVVHGGSTVRLEPTDGGFAVTDDGPGIDETDRDRVFESGYTRSTDRTGFGLAIVEWTAQAHGWTARLAEADDGTRIVVDGVLRV